MRAGIEAGILFPDVTRGYAQPPKPEPIPGSSPAMTLRALSARSNNSFAGVYPDPHWVRYGHDVSERPAALASVTIVTRYNLVKGST
jgi:hypothetical protein